MADLKFDNHAETKNDRMKPLVTGSDMSISQRGFTMKVVKAAAVQLSPVLYSREGTVEKVVWKIRELGSRGD